MKAMRKKERQKRRKGFRVPVMSAEKAVQLIQDEDMVAFCGAGGGITEASEVINALAERYRTTGSPKNLYFWHSTGLGDRKEKGMSPLAQKGLVRGAIGGHWGQSPQLAEMADRNEIEAYNIPMGVMTNMIRAASAGQPYIVTKVGLHTFLDPRQQGGKLNDVTRQNLIQLVEFGGEEWLQYKTIWPDVAIIRGTTADTEGYVSMEDEVVYVDNLATAMAVHNNGGIVICQVQKVVKAGSLHPRRVSIPGYLIDAIVVVPDQPQLYGAPVNRFISGDYVEDFSEDRKRMPLTERKVIARRALMEVEAGDIGNVGVGICDGIGVVAKEEGVENDFVLTVETGAVGGVTAQGIFFGASVNTHAIVDMPSQFDFYDGGGLDVSFLSFAELDRDGNVNVHKFNHKSMGTGGFTNICQCSKKAVFCGTLTSGGLKTKVGDGKIEIVNEGRYKKFVEKVDEITFNGKMAAEHGQKVVYITERCVFENSTEGMVLTEIAPGMDLEKDILPFLAFDPIISPECKTMDERLFREEDMGIKKEFESYL